MNFDILWQRAKQFRKELLVISGLSLLSSAATLAVPWLAGQLLGGIITNSARDLDQILMLLVAALVGLTGLTILSAIASSKASLRILGRLRADVYRHIQLLPISFHERRKGGDLLSLITFEVNNLSSFLVSTLANAPSMMVTAAGAVIILFLIDPGMAFAIPVLVPIFFIVMKLIGRRMRVIARRTRRAEVAVVERADNDLRMLPAIKAFAREEEHQMRYIAAVDAARRLSFRQARLNAFIAPLVSLVAALAVIAILLIGSGDLASGEREPGELFAFLLYAALLTRPVGALADMYGKFQIAKGTLSRLENVLSMPSERGFDSGERIDRASGEITIEDLHFSYPGRPKVLDGVDLSIKPGEIIALTGDNGVGKSTLVKLLLRYYAPDSGKILLDGKDIADLQVQDLRRQFGYVPQRPLLFNGTIAENIAFGCDGGTPQSQQAALERACKLAQADAFIAQLPQQFATVIGDNGLRLSGGQGQRVALARALYTDPPIYILDEATSMYDLESEAAFVEDCIESLKNRTVIIITHRPASLGLADRIFEVSSSAITQVSAAQ